MPSMDQFSDEIYKHAKSVIATAVGGLKSASSAGANYMRDVIQNSASTGTEWHRDKNLLNGYEVGARIGSKIAIGRYGPSDNPGNMLRSVGVSEPSVDGETVSVRFGWVKPKATDDYFVRQDTGSYKEGGVGMGLLNEVEDGKGMSAVLYTESYLIKLMKAARFKVSGGFVG